VSNLEQLAYKLETARETVRRAYRETYPQVVQPYSDSIKRRMLATGEGELLATLECAKNAPGPMAQLFFLSAGMEMVAPSDCATVNTAKGQSI